MCPWHPMVGRELASLAKWLTFRCQWETLAQRTGLASGIYACTHMWICTTTYVPNVHPPSSQRVANWILAWRCYYTRNHIRRYSAGRKCYSGVCVWSGSNIVAEKTASETSRVTIIMWVVVWTPDTCDRMGTGKRLACFRWSLRSELGWKHPRNYRAYRKVELEIMSPFTLLQDHSEKAVWAAVSMRIRYIFTCDIVSFIIEYIVW